MHASCRRLLLPIAIAAMLQAALASAQSDESAAIRSLLSRGDSAAALQRAEKATAANPRDAELRFMLGVVWMEMGRNDDALDLFIRMSQEYPELPDPFNNIALLQVRGGRLEAARQSLEAALRNDPAHRSARANLGQVHLMLAVQAWEAAAAAGPLDIALQRKLEGARALLAAAPLGGR